MTRRPEVRGKWTRDDKSAYNDSLRKEDPGCRSGSFPQGSRHGGQNWIEMISE
jgi:hypothetical protein